MGDPHVALERIRQDFLHDYWAWYPTTAVALGLHSYDGQIVDLSFGAIEARLAALRSYRRRLAALAPQRSRLRAVARLDYELLRWRAGYELWRLHEEESQRWSPLDYLYNLLVDGYLKRAYAPPEIRMDALARHLAQVPAALALAERQLEPGPARLAVEEALAAIPGLERLLSSVVDAALKTGAAPAELPALRDRALAAVRRFGAFLADDLLPAATADFAWGRRRLSGWLRHGEMVDLTPAALLAIGEADLDRNRAALASLAARLSPGLSPQRQLAALYRDHPPPAQVLATARDLLADLRSFVADHAPLTLPALPPCEVAPTPDHARVATALFDYAGPFAESAAPAFYYLTLPLAGWPAQQVAAWMQRLNYATLTCITIHEVYPGHGLHFARMRDLASPLARTFWSQAHLEGWAHYAEAMVLDAGYGAHDPRLRLAQLAEAIIADCRLICAVKLHTQGMSLEAATRFFMRQAALDEVIAVQEARRCALDPAVLCYTLGKLMLSKLRADYERVAGADFLLQRFHDDVLSYGAPPIPLLRRMLLPDDNGVLV